MNDSGYDVVGIDLGTTNSCVAVWKNGQIAIVPNEVGKRTTPSIVSFLPTETLVGNSAAKKMMSNYKNTVYDCKADSFFGIPVISPVRVLIDKPSGRGVC